METITITKSELQSLLCDVIFTENNIDMFLSENYRAIRFSNEYLDSKDRFNLVISKLTRMIER